MDDICELAASNLRFGPGSTSEVGQDLAFWKIVNNKVIIVTDSNLVNMPQMDVLKASLEESNVRYVIYPHVRVEPNDVSFQHAIDFFTTIKQQEPGGYGAVVALGGGSVIDTAKAANLYATFPPPEGDFYDYVNPPLGKGLPVPADSYNKNSESGGILPPLIAIPTTAGTGSETTGVAIFDDSRTKSKTGIASRRLKPTLAIIDPNNTITLPSRVAIYSGLDVLCHAMESYTALPYNNQRPKPISPAHRPAYQGSNPISDIWSMYALQRTAKYLRRAAKAGEANQFQLQQRQQQQHQGKSFFPDVINDLDGDDLEARSNMLLAAVAAGMGFGNAGVHLCHGMSYPISSQVPSSYANAGSTSSSSRNNAGESDKTNDSKYRAVKDRMDYAMGQDSTKNINSPTFMNDGHALIPHGLSVIVAAPAVFSFTGCANPDRHAICANILKQTRLGNDTDEYGVNNDIDVTLSATMKTSISSTTSSTTTTNSSDIAGNWLAEEIRYLLDDLNVGLGLRKEFGYTDDDIPNLVAGTLPQHRVTKLSPRQVNEKDLEVLFYNSIHDI